MFSRQQYFCTAVANFPAAGSHTTIFPLVETEYRDHEAHYSVRHVAIFGIAGISTPSAFWFPFCFVVCLPCDVCNANRFQLDMSVFMPSVTISSCESEQMGTWIKKSNSLRLCMILKFKIRFSVSDTILTESLLFPRMRYDSNRVFVVSTNAIRF